MAKSKYLFDVLALLFFAVMGIVVTVVLKTSFLFSIILFFSLPSIYISCRKKEVVAKSVLFSLLFTIPLTTFLDYMAVLDKSWFVPETVFSSRLFGIVPYEDFIWAFFFVYLIVVFYEYFFDHGKEGDKLPKNIIYMILLFNSVLAIFFLILNINPNMLRIEYFYLKAGIVVALVPLILVFSFYPSLWRKCFATTVYFTPLFLSFELAGLYANQWEFDKGNFVGLIGFYNLKFPIEELFFWIILGSVWILSYYEYFADDRS